MSAPVNNGSADSLSRREFVKHSAAVAATIGLAGSAYSVAAPRRASRMKVGVIGCGGRGTGAAVNILNASPDVEIRALGDMFPDRIEGCKSELAKLPAGHSERSLVGAEQSFTGFDAYTKVLAGDVDIVILATPPGFRPIHFEAAVKAGKHVFMEKPVAVDGGGIRRVLAAAEESVARKLCVVTGTQRRHEKCYLETMAKIKGGAIGKIVGASCYWNQGGLWMHKRKAEWSDMEWQLRNWLYFAWLSGDHIVEQHVHNLDVMNWAIGSHPLKATGMGGRQVRTAPDYGHVFDHFAVEYEYPDGVTMQSFCRQIDGCAGRVEEVVRGTEGWSTTRSGFGRIDGRETWKFEGENPDPYVREQVDLLAAIASGKPINEARQVAESTLTAIMGRMSTYTGKAVTWEQALSSRLDLSPAKYELGEIPVAEVAVPGKTPLV